MPIVPADDPHGWEPVEVAPCPGDYVTMRGGRVSGRARMVLVTVQMEDGAHHADRATDVAVVRKRPVLPPQIVRDRRIDLWMARGFFVALMVASHSAVAYAVAEPSMGVPAGMLAVFACAFGLKGIGKR